MKCSPCCTLKLCLIVCFTWIIIQITVYHFSNQQERSTSNSWLGRSARLMGKLVPVKETGFGHMGHPVQLPASLVGESKAKFSKHQFDIVVSDLIGSYRELPDYRHLSCKDIPADRSLEAWKTSVIIVFHNEAQSTLLRTINSVIRRTPRNLLEEIILVDDASTDRELGGPLDGLVSTLPVPCHVERMGNRSGLVKARLRGAGVAKGKSLTFLDAHCEATTGWLEPLLYQLVQNPHRVVSPSIDVINEHSFQYVPGAANTLGYFDWKLTFHWGEAPEHEIARTHGDPNIPFRTPSMAGGLFTISKAYFEHLGTYDEGMIVWGGENVEMSLRIWQCGGELLILPCSRVGHVFRSVSPYTWPGGVNHVLARNSLRTALVWMDEYKDFYLKSNPDIAHTDYGEVSERIALREKLQCKSFRWYLENVNPESVFPLSYHGLGEVRHEATGLCLDTLGQKEHSPVGLSPCHGLGGNQLFVWTTKGELQTHTGCVSSKDLNSLYFERCVRRDASPQIFNYNHKKLVHHASQKCLAVLNNLLVLGSCDDSPSFHWFVPGFTEQDQLEHPVVNNHPKET